MATPDQPPPSLGRQTPEEVDAQLQRLRAMMGFIPSASQPTHETFALGVLRDFAPEHRIIAVQPGWRLNDDAVPAGHFHAVLDSEGETLATAPELDEAIEAAAREALRRYTRQAESDAYCLARMRAAFKTLETGGAE